MRKLTADELLRESKVKKWTYFTEAIKRRYSNSLSVTASSRPNPKDADETYDLTFDELAPKLPEADIVDYEGTPIHPTSMADILMNAEVLRPQR